MSKKDYIKQIENAERRFVTATVTIENRADDNNEGPAVIEGYASLFNSRTNIGGWFREEILPGAFDDVLQDDVRCLFNHDPNKILARSEKGKGTLAISVDKKGLKYRYETPDISYAKDLAESIRLGNVSQSSFGFRAKEVVWIEEEGKPDLRQIKKMERLYDVSPVTYPAYQDTTVAKRSHDAFVAENKPTKKENERADTLDVCEAQYLYNKNNQ